MKSVAFSELHDELGTRSFRWVQQVARLAQWSRLVLPPGGAARRDPRPSASPTAAWAPGLMVGEKLHECWYILAFTVR